MLLALIIAPAQALEVITRDSHSGLAVNAQLAVWLHAGEHTQQPQRPADLNFRIDGTLKLNWPDGHHRVIAQASGYTTMHTHHLQQDGQGIETLVLFLDPLHTPPQPAAPRANQALVQGHIGDANHAPLAQATVHLASAPEQVTRSDANGYFILHVNDLRDWRLDQLTVAAAGHRTRLQEIAVHSGDVLSLQLTLSRGSGREMHRWQHRQLNDLGGALSAPLGGTQPTPIAAAQAADSRAVILDPAASIRVGFASAACDVGCCSGATSCAHVCVFSLETYVKRGLNDEWISSWGQQSLRAGSVAYRSYGMWHTVNPLYGTHDICSNACCQVNDPNTTANTDLAVDNTAGVVLQRDGAVFRAEYSAENNAWDDPNDGLNCSNGDLSCGNGAVGSPATGWPCLNDLVATDRGCFGHGRGMSQWGTFRWDGLHGENWKWIVNHYYNANGQPDGLRSAFMTSPLRIDSSLATPASLPAGDVLGLALQVTNSSTLTHHDVLIGASLFSPATGYIDDPAGDAGQPALPGANVLLRNFLVPPGTPAGAYDLLVALWLDVDEDAAISGDDLVLTQTTLPGAIQIIDDVIFRSGFDAAAR